MEAENKEFTNSETFTVNEGENKLPERSTSSEFFAISLSEDLESDTHSPTIEAKPFPFEDSNTS